MGLYLSFAYIDSWGTFRIDYFNNCVAIVTCLTLTLLTHKRVNRFIRTPLLCIAPGALLLVVVLYPDSPWSDPRHFWVLGSIAWIVYLAFATGFGWHLMRGRHVILYTYGSIVWGFSAYLCSTLFLLLARIVIDDRYGIDIDPVATLIGATAFYAICMTTTIVVTARQMLNRRRLHQRSSLDLCLSCGYDLRGTLPGRPCPECGVMQSEKPHRDESPASAA